MEQPRHVCRVLVVDDDANVRDIVAGTLGLEGYRVATADSGAIALPFVAADLPQIIVLDMQMPGLSGWDLAEALKEGGITIPILVLTAAHDPEAVAREIGAADWLAKPFDLVDLLAKVERICAEA
jgi:two-component system, OmpR family, response regulator MprA